jgi:hypothetical protein
LDPGEGPGTGILRHASCISKDIWRFLIIYSKILIDMGKKLTFILMLFAVSMAFLPEHGIAGSGTGLGKKQHETADARPAVCVSGRYGSWEDRLMTHNRNSDETGTNDFLLLIREVELVHVPEPASLLIIGSCLAGIAGLVRRRNRGNNSTPPKR